MNVNSPWRTQIRPKPLRAKTEEELNKLIETKAKEGWMVVTPVTRFYKESTHSSVNRGSKYQRDYFYNNGFEVIVKFVGRGNVKQLQHT